MVQRNTPSGASYEAPEPDDAELDDLDTDAGAYDDLMELERLESLEEEMMELGMTTLEEVRQRIADLHRAMDDQER